MSHGSPTALLDPVVLAVTALVISAGAAIVDGPADRIDDGASLQPGDDPYTHPDEDGELVIDVTESNPRLDAVNVDALTIEDGLFYIVRNGSEPAAVRIEHDSPDVTFVVGGDPVEGDKDPAIATPDGGPVPMGIKVDTRVVDLMPGDRVIDGISAHARPADPETVTQGGDGNDGNRSNDDERAAEPTALDLADFAGLAALVAMVLATLFLFRRAPW